MNISAVLLTVTLSVISCSSSVKFDADGDKVLSTLLKQQYYRPNGQDFLEVKLVKTITAEDSMKIILNNESLMNKIVTDYNMILENLRYQIKNPSSFYNVEENITEINRYADAFDGKFDDVQWSRQFLYKYIYQNLFKYRTAPKDQVLVKIYSIKYRTKKVLDSDKVVEKTDYFLMKPNLEGNYEGKKGVEVTNPIPHPNFDIENLHFKHFVRE